MDIQVLRGLAVFAVVLYHFQIPAFHNGFLGVDIFFVISGYLMRETYAPSDNKHFYFRRAKRLLPGYFLTVILTILIAFFRTIPSDFRQVIQQARSSLLFIPNIHFWAQESYFSNSHFNPLLHLWSLGVEFQFYLLVPVFALLFKRNRAMVLIFFLISLLCCLLLLPIFPKPVFFLLPFRAWEFLAGWGLKSLPTIVSSLRTNKSARLTFLGALALGGLLFLALPVSGNAPNIFLGHPGFAAVFIVAMTSCFILFEFSLPKTLLFTLLEQIGKYSYSIYLVHFPILMLLVYRPFRGNSITSLNWQTGILTFLLLGITSYFFFKHVEQRFKTSSKQILSFVFASLFAVVSLPLLIEVQNQNYSTFKQNISSAYSNRVEYRCGLWWRIRHPTPRTCIIGSSHYNSKLLLLGNSHADAIKNVLAKAANSHGATTYFWVKNNALMGLNPEIEDVEDEIKSKGISSVILHYSAGAVSPVVMQKFVSRLVAAGVTILFIGPVPTWKVNVPEAMWNLTEQNLRNLEQSFSHYSAHNAKEIRFYQSLVGSGIEYLDLGSILCRSKCLYADAQGIPYYWDSDHLTLSGASLLSSALDDVVFKLVKSSDIGWQK